MNSYYLKVIFICFLLANIGTSRIENSTSTTFLSHYWQHLIKNTSALLKSPLSNRSTTQHNLAGQSNVGTFYN